MADALEMTSPQILSCSLDALTTLTLWDQSTECVSQMARGQEFNQPALHLIVCLD